MSFYKSAAATALVAAAALSLGMTAASAHGGKNKGLGLGIGKSHLSFNNGKFNKVHRKSTGVGTIVIGSSGFDCSYWFHRYKKTGNPFFLDRYYACIY